jgi:hypothetical protein
METSKHTDHSQNLVLAPPLQKKVKATPPLLVPNPIVTAQPGQYCDIHVDVPKVLKSWQRSIFSFEWMRPDGVIKTRDELSQTEAEKRLLAESMIEHGRPLMMSLLGIGIMDNVEIGSGRAEFLTLAALGHKILPVHIPIGNKADFKPFLAVLD